MLYQKLSIIGVIIAALSITACNPIPANPVPTPTPAPFEREPLQISLYDFANFMARQDGNAREPAQYADAILKIVACMDHEVENSAEVENYTPGEKAVAYWWITGIFMAQVFEQEVPLGDENGKWSMHSWLKAAHTLCTELD